jgi:hypothetical protein
VNTPVRSDFSSAHSSVGDRAGIIVRIFIVVSSLCTCDYRKLRPV